MRACCAWVALVLAALLVDAATGQSTRAASPVFFVENRDRFESAVRYYVEEVDGAICLEDRSIVFRRHSQADWRLEFPNARAGVRPRGEAPLETRLHYLIGADPSKWRTDVPTFAQVRFRALWHGIDLVIQATERGLKYEFHVAPGADPGVIAMRYVGARTTIREDGALEIDCASRHVDPAPVSFQRKCNGTRTTVATSFALDPDSPGTVGFTVADYDRSKPLVIDPVFVVHSGYLVPGMITVGKPVFDSQGRMFVGGMVTSQDRQGDAAFARIRADASGFDFITVFGGPNAPDTADVARVDATGIYVGGGTYSNESAFPVVVGPDLTHNGNCDGYVAKFALDGKTILFCGYVGGSAYDSGQLVVDSAGAIWLAGSTESADFPVVGGPQTTLPSGESGFVTKVAPDGRSLLVSGYIGGASGFYQRVFSLDLDSNDDVYLLGWTAADETTFPVKIGPQTKAPGDWSCFVAKIAGQTGAVVYSGFVGGARFDQPFDIAVDAQGAAYVTGITFSDETSFPVIAGPRLTARPTLVGTEFFVSKIHPTGAGFGYSGFLGGMRPDAVAVDRQGRCYLAGTSLYGISYPFPSPFPLGGALSSINAGGADGTVCRLAVDGRSFDYGGHFGGTGTDRVVTIALGPTGALYLTGITDSRGTFPTRIGPSLVDNNINNPLGPNLPGTFLTRIGQTVAAVPQTARPGTVVPVDCVASEDVGFPFQVATALGVGPIPLPGGRRLALGPDALFQASVLGAWPGVFQNYAGVVPPTGEWRSVIRLPASTALVGLQPRTAFATFAASAPGGINSVSNAAVVRIVP